MSRKIWGDTDYYTTKELFEAEGKDGETYDKRVNKVTNDLFVHGFAFDCEKNPYEDPQFIAWISWATDALNTNLYFALPFGDGNKWWTFITTDITSPTLTIDEKRYMLYALFMSAESRAYDWIYTFNNGTIYFLRDDYFKIRDYMGIDLPVEHLSDDYTLKQPTKLFNVLRDSGHIFDFPVPIDEMWLIKNGDYFNPEITFEIATYNRTYTGWFGYVFQPNCRDHFLSYDKFQKSNGEIIYTVRITEWRSSIINSAVSDACTQYKDKLDPNLQPESWTSENVRAYNDALYYCLYAAGLFEVEDDIKRIYNNTDWCLRNDLKIMIDKLDLLCYNLQQIKNTTQTDSIDTKAIPYYRAIFNNFANLTSDLKNRIMTSGPIAYWKGGDRVKKNEEVTFWYTKLGPNDLREDCWEPFILLFTVETYTLAIDYPKLFDYGVRWLYKQLQDSDIEDLSIVQESKKQDESVEISYDEQNQVYKVDGTTTVITTQNFDNVPFNIQKYFYWLVENYNRNAGKDEYNPLEIYSATFDMNDLLIDLDLDSDILMFLRRDVGKILEYMIDYTYTTQLDLAAKLIIYKHTFNSIKYLERFWEIFMLPDTIERYAVARSRMYRVSIDDLPIQVHMFEPGVSETEILSNGGAVIQLRLKELNVEIANNWLIVPDITYHGSNGDWFLYGRQISENRENTVIIGDAEYEKMYYFHFEINGQSIDIPWLQFDLSDVPYTEAPEVKDLVDMSMVEYLEYMTEINYQQLQMLDVLINICEECCKYLGTINKDDNEYSIFGLESYDQEQLQRFYPIYSALIEYEEEICNKIGDLNTLLIDQETQEPEKQSWLYKALNITEDKNNFIIKITSGRFIYNGDTNKIERNHTVEDYIGSIRTNFNTIVRLVENNQYKYYTSVTIDPITYSSDLIDSGSKRWLWYNGKTGLEDYKGTISNSATIPIYIENIQTYYRLYYKQPINSEDPEYTFKYIYILYPDSNTPKLVMSGHDYDNYATDDTLKTQLKFLNIITVGENDTITKNYTKYTIEN